MTMVREPLDLNPSPYQRVPRPERSFHGYYKRPHLITQTEGPPIECDICDGWVVEAASFYPNRVHYEEKGFVFLDRYGQFLPGAPRDASPDSYNGTDANGAFWNPTTEPWRRILQLGGAREFPICQLIEFGWHRNPPYKGLRFPQLEKVKITDLDCPECRRSFASLNPAQAVSSLRQHLVSRVDEAHSYSPSDLRELGREMGISFSVRGLRRSERAIERERDEEEEETPVLELGQAEIIATNDAEPKAVKKSAAKKRSSRAKARHRSDPIRASADAVVGSADTGD